MKEYPSFLFPYAYNILGTVDDAKDAIQDVLLKYSSKNITVENERGYLIRGVINQSINLKERLKKTQPHAIWLPEPVAMESSDQGFELREMVSYSLLFLLERLTPKERAVFILKEAFAYTHEEIAGVLPITLENSRKLLSRAHKKVQQKEGKITSETKKEHFSQLEAIISAIRKKDLDTLHQLFAKDITLYADGGKKVSVVRSYCDGVEDVSDLLIYVFHNFLTKHTVKPVVVNHQPALLYFLKDKVKVCQVMEFTPGGRQVRRVSAILDPFKLQNLEHLVLE